MGEDISAPMELFLIRHAQSFNNSLTDSSQRVADPELTDLGHIQAAYLADFVAAGTNRAPQRKTYVSTPDTHRGEGFGINRLICSPMWRALQTAYYISERTGLAPEVWPDIHEQGGIYLEQGSDGPVGLPGKSRTQILEGFPNALLPDTINEQGWWNNREFETWDVCYRRAERVVDQLFAILDRPERIGMVSHGAFLDALLKVLVKDLVLRIPGEFGIPAPMYFQHYNTGISHLRFMASGAMDIVYLNRVEHLPPEMVS